MSAAILLLGIASLTILLLCSHTLKIYGAIAKPISSLGFSPNQLTGLDVAVIICVVISKSVLRLANLLPTLRPSTDGQGFALPELRLSAPLCLEVRDSVAYQNALSALDAGAAGEISSNQAPERLSLFLAAQTTPLMLLIVAHYKSPILPFGAVNTRNRFEFISPQACLRSTGRMKAAATFGGPQQAGRRTKRGIEFDVIITVTEETSPDNASDSDLIFRQIITVMQSLSKQTRPVFNEDMHTSSSRGPIDTSGAHLMPLPTTLHASTWAPLAWARVCRDYNPIHMSSVAARLLGLPGQIAHGNHVVAAAVEKIRETDRLARTPWAMDVAFRRPMAVPVCLELVCSRDGALITQFAVTQHGKVHVEGRIAPLEPRDT